MLPKSFFAQNAPQLAKALLGCVLIHETHEGISVGIIVETEAYSQEDAASHSCRGQTERTKVMFGPGGRAYIYFTYGMHYCFNVVSGPAGHGQAVLLRALQPIEGIGLMKQRRGKDKEIDLCSGPAKLVKAMGISKSDYGKDLSEGNLRIERTADPAPKVSVGPRIGISQARDTPWRFWVTDNKYVSR